LLPVAAMSSQLAVRKTSKRSALARGTRCVASLHSSRLRRGANDTNALNVRLPPHPSPLPQGERGQGVPATTAFPLPSVGEGQGEGVFLAAEHYPRRYESLGDRKVTSREVHNIFDGAATAASPGDETIAGVFEREGLRIERIISNAHASPPGFWYEQDWSEWVILLAGSAGLRFEGETEPRPLKAGDYVIIPAKIRHRVDWTSGNEPAVWLAVHFDEKGPAGDRSSN
jgi:cupin 2 domain-containing protein